MKEIKDFEGYFATKDGKIYSERSKKFLNLNNTSKGYAKCNLYRKNGSVKSVRVHRIIWEAFNGPIPNGYEINHKNEIRNDNRLENLELLTHKENLNYGNHKIKLKESLKKVVKRGRNCNFSKPICVYSIKEGGIYNFSTRMELAQFFGVTKRHLLYKMHDKRFPDGAFELNGLILKERK